MLVVTGNERSQHRLVLERNLLDQPTNAITQRLGIAVQQHIDLDGISHLIRGKGAFRLGQLFALEPTRHADIVGTIVHFGFPQRPLGPFGSRLRDVWSAPVRVSQ